MADRAERDIDQKALDKRLFRAVNDESMEELEAALAAGASPRSQSRGVSALEHAARMGAAAVARRLIEAGAEVDETVAEDFTPLMAAAIGGSAECVKALLAAGADPDRVNAAGFCAGHLGLRGGNIECLRLLLEAGADPVGAGRWSWARFAQLDEEVPEAMRGEALALLEKRELEPEAKKGLGAKKEARL